MTGRLIGKQTLYKILKQTLGEWSSVWKLFGSCKQQKCKYCYKLFIRQIFNS